MVRRKSNEKKIEIIKQIVYEKASYNKVSNKELDKTTDGARDGLTAEIIKIFRSNRQCKALLLKQ